MSQTKPTEAEVRTYAMHYILHGDQTAAWRHTYPNSRSKPEGVWRNASLMHARPEVKEAIAKCQAQNNQALEDQFNIDAGKIREMLVSAAQIGLEFDEKGRPISLQGTVSALAEINKMNGNHAATKIAGDPSQPLSVVTMSSDEYRKIRAEMLNDDSI